MLTVEEDWELVEASLAAGAIGYVAKPRLASDLPIAIERASKAYSFVTPTIHYESEGPSDPKLLWRSTAEGNLEPEMTPVARAEIVRDAVRGILDESPPPR